MTITQGETGFVVEDYNAGKTLRTSVAYQLTAHRYNLDFDTAYGSAVGLVEHFDSIIFGDSIYRVTADTLEYLVSGVWTSVSGYSPPAGLIANGAQLSVSGASLYVTVPTVDGIQQAVWNVSSWSSWTTLDSDEAAYLSTPSPDRVHYLYHRADNNYHFRCLDNGDKIESGIYYGYPIQGFDAIAHTDRDILVIAASVPGHLSAKVVNTTVQNTVLDAAALVAFEYRYRSWSDPVMVDFLDEQSASRWRRYPRLTHQDGVTYLSAYASEGKPAHPVLFNRIYKCFDGHHWTRGYGVILDAYTGFDLHRVGDFVYAVTSDLVQRSDSTLFVHHSSPAVQLVLTDDLLSMSLSKRDMGSVQLVLDNQDRWLDSTFLSGQAVVHLILKVGRDLDHLVQVGRYEIDTYGMEENVPVDQVSISARDLLAWMAGKSQSESFRQWEPQVVGGDHYEDNTGTGYGGMLHTGPIEGSFKTVDGALRIGSSMRDNMALSTYFYENWNGAAQVRIYLPQTAPLVENAGIMFRVQDKANHWAALVYNDRLALYQRVGNTDYLKAQSATDLEWTDPDWYTIRAEWYFSRIRLYSSDGKGRIWTEEVDYIAPGKSGTDPFTQHGEVGLRGFGLVPDDTWSTPTTPTTAGNVPRPFLSGTGTIGGIDTAGNVRLTRNWSNTAPTWKTTAISGISGMPCSFVIDPRSPYYLGSGARVNGLVVTTTHAYYVEDLCGAPVVRNGVVLGGTTVNRMIEADRGTPGLFAIATYYGNQSPYGTWVHVTSDYGANWSAHQVTGAWDINVANNANLYNQVGIFIRDAVIRVWAMTGANGGHGVNTTFFDIYAAAAPYTSWSIDADLSQGNSQGSGQFIVSPWGMPDKWYVGRAAFGPNTETDIRPHRVVGGVDTDITYFSGSEPLTSGTNNQRAFAVSDDDFNYLLSVGYNSSDGRGLLRSLDGGVSWDVLITPPASPYLRIYLGGRTGFVIGQNLAVAEVRLDGTVVSKKGSMSGSASFIGLFGGPA